MPDTSSVYRPRKPQESQYYQCVEDNFEALEQVYDERFATRYGFFRPCVKQVIYRFLDCGILHNGFARVKCGDCGHEYLLAFSKGKTTQDLVDMLMNWRHSGFNVFCGSRIQPGDETAMENLARYIIRASFSQEWMAYIPEEPEVIYRSKDGTEEKVFDALEWLAAMCSHVPNKGEQMVRYYGYYSNVSRGKRKNEDNDELIPSILEPDGSSKEFRRNWARLIQKIYEVDPFNCAKCQGKMRIIAFIEDEEVIKKILKHLGLWEIKQRSPPKPPEYSIDCSVSQLPGSDNWLYADPVYSETFAT